MLGTQSFINQVLYHTSSNYSTLYSPEQAHRHQPAISGQRYSKMSHSEHKKVLVVFGATGLQGGSIVEQILSDPKASSQFSIRGITRDPTKPAAKALTAKGVDCVAVCHYVPARLF